MNSAQPLSPTRDVLWSLIGFAAPLPVALLTVPILATAIGTARFGVLALMLAIVGYSSFLDLGIGRALTKIVAGELAAQSTSVGSMIRTAVTLLGVMGVCGTAVMIVVAPALTDFVMRMPGELRDESIASLRVMSLALPFITMTSGLRGTLEAHHQFRQVSILNTLVGTSLLLVPVLALPLSKSLVSISVSILAVRIVGWLCYAGTVRKLSHFSNGSPAFVMSNFKPLLGLGGWITVSNIIGPFLTYFDRFIIGAVASVNAVAFYTVPYDVVTRLSVFPTALNSVLFPAFSRSYGRDQAEAIRLITWGLNKAYLIMFPISVTLMFLAPDFLRIWVGAEFQRQSAGAMQWLSAGLLVNALAQTPFVFLQGAGRPDLTAKLHSAELVPYIALLIVLVSQFGVVGAAAAWAIRACVDALLLLWLSDRLVDETSGVLVRGTIFAAIISLLLAISQIPLDLHVRLFFLVLIGICFVVVAWNQLLSASERQAVGTMIVQWKSAAEGAASRH